MQTASKAGWNFDNSYARLPDIFYRRLEPTPVRAPALVVLNEPLAAELGLRTDALRSDEGVAAFAGNRVPGGAEPLAQSYAGHQFGHFTMLGDGRALLLGEQLTPGGSRVDIQLKGAGPTPYSRQGDGRAALGPMLREYIISEAMHALGIPTTRSLAVATTGQPVYREETLPGAVLTRTAASHLRVGTFQFAAQFAEKDQLQALADYALQRHDPEGIGAPHPYLHLLRKVIERQASLLAQWQLVGFVHGVMNTDNMTISGETIDYGPCAFIDVYDPAAVFSSIDRQGRYAFARQPQIAVWNLSRFAESLLPLLDDDEDTAVQIAEEALGAFAGLFTDRWLSGMRAKLGCLGEAPEDEALIRDLLDMMRKAQADYTNVFRALTFERVEETGLTVLPEYADWQARWRKRKEQSGTAEEAATVMRRANPAVIPRNHRVEEALAAAVDEGDYSVMESLLAALADPYAHSPEQEPYCSPPPPSPERYRTYCGT